MRKVQYVVFADNGTVSLSDGQDVLVFDSMRRCVDAAREALEHDLPLVYFGGEVVENASFAKPPENGEEATRHQWVQLEALNTPDTVHGTWKVVHDFLALFTGRPMANFYKPMVLPRISRAD